MTTNGLRKGLLKELEEVFNDAEAMQGARFPYIDDALERIRALHKEVMFLVRTMGMIHKLANGEGECIVKFDPHDMTSSNKHTLGIK